MRCEKPEVIGIFERLVERLSRKTDYIGIDIDDTSVFNLLLTYFSLKQKFPDSEIIVELSSSGTGFHIIVKLKQQITILENFFERSLFDDDAMRLKLNLKKFYLSDGKDHNFDLLFTEKSGKKVKKIELDKILDKYKYLVSKIYMKWGTNEALEMIDELAEKIKKYIKTDKRWVTSIGIKGDVMLHKIGKIAEDIASIDDTFKYRIFKSYFPEYDFCMCIFSNSRTQAYQRGAWFKKIIKTELNEDILYYVKCI